MLRNVVKLLIMLTAITSSAMAAENAQPVAKLSATEIVDRNVAARGGLQAWRAVQTLSMSGKMEAGGNSRTVLPMPGRKDSRYMPPPRPAEQVKLPFVMDLKRPLKTRVKILFSGKNAIQVFDGAQGWKLRPFLNRLEVEPYTEEEMKSTASQAELDGPLVDYAAKGTKIDLMGTEKVEGRQTYKLKLTLKSGAARNVWIDAETFLEAKIEGNPRRLDGKDHPVEVYYRDYRSVGGLKFPYILETRVVNLQPVAGAVQRSVASEQIQLEKVEVNPKLSDALFSKADLDAVASAKPTATASAVKLSR